MKSGRRDHLHTQGEKEKNSSSQSGRKQGGRKKKKKPTLTPYRGGRNHEKEIKKSKSHTIILQIHLEGRRHKNAQ